MSDLPQSGDASAPRPRPRASYQRMLEQRSSWPSTLESTSALASKGGRTWWGGRKPATGADAPVKVRRPGPRGWLGRGAGESVVVEPAPEWRGTTVQVCGLFPFGAGAGTPVVGVPLGRHLTTGATVCCDPISWFQRARLIRNPSMGILGLPGLGKSTAMRRIITGLAGYGTIPLILGDVRPDYVDLIQTLGGDVISLGGARGFLNPLDIREPLDAAARIRAAATRAGAHGDDDEQGRLEQLASELMADARARREALIGGLITAQRGGPISENEVSILSAALGVLDAEHPDGEPVLADLLQVVRSAPQEVRDVAVDRDDMTRYQAKTEGLEGSLISMVRGGRLGQTFSRRSSAQMRRDRPVVFDLGGIQDAEETLRGAALVACWSVGFGMVNIAQALASAKLEPQRHYLIVQDELHQGLRSGPGMVERYDRLSRLNRKFGVGQILCTHTMHDLYSLPTDEEREKARGLFERCGVIMLGGLPAAEMPLLTQVTRLAGAEQDLLSRWNEPPAWDPETGEEASPPGLGHFLIKVAGKPGIPFRVELTATERAGNVHDTNRLWKLTSRIGAVAPDGGVAGG